jgi:hypothetical protein
MPLMIVESNCVDLIAIFLGDRQCCCGVNAAAQEDDSLSGAGGGHG